MNNASKLKAAYNAFFGISHNLTFDEYVAFNLKGHNEMLARCDMAPITVERFLAL
jgi:hypothetical protein